MITFNLPNTTNTREWARRKLNPGNYAVLDQKLLICISDKVFHSLISHRYEVDPFTGETMRVTRPDGVYPVKIDQNDDIVLMQYDNVSLCFHEAGCDTEYWKDSDFKVIGERINVN